jgi:HSP20 family molecular chaperone IbpA
MPGVEAKDVKVDFDQSVLTIRASQSMAGPAGECVCREYEQGAYERSFTVSDQVDAGKIAAQYAQGVLTLTLPKAEAAKPRTIEVKAD